jgi:flagellar biosynthetic protein FliR
MPVELKIPLDSLYGFLLVLARVSGALSFVPMPGLRAAPVVGRAMAALALTIALHPVWPRLAARPLTPGELAMGLLAELAFGAAVGLAVAFLNEAFVLSSQIYGLQAGYGYASTIDPATQADSSVLQILAHLAAGLMFFSLGFDREILRLFARSLEACPPGACLLDAASATQLLRLGAVMCSTAVRLALPVVALLVMIDLALALLGRINAQLQLLMLAFPVKMLASMVVLAAVAVLLPAVYRGAAEEILRVLAAAVPHSAR